MRINASICAFESFRVHARVAARVVQAVEDRGFRWLGHRKIQSNFSQKKLTFGPRTLKTDNSPIL